jgi:hypothetical protein
MYSIGNRAASIVELLHPGNQKAVGEFGGHPARPNEIVS